HRIYDIEVVEGKPVYITKGDANNAPDNRKITKKDIVGKVLFDVPYLGYAVETARKPIGFVLLIIVPAGIIVYDEIRKIVGEIKKRKQES
ncbi:MAG: signal peptidase I, partial [Chloroflexi bacterium]